MTNETQALAHLVSIADGYATPEAVSVLAMDLASPWASYRRLVRDRPPVLAPLHERDLLALLDELAPHLAPSWPGPGAWLARHRLAVPLAALSVAPAWATDPVLTDAWVALPPRGFSLPGSFDRTALELDGRLAALHVLARQARAAGGTPEAIRAPVVPLTEWICGPRMASWSEISGGQASELRTHWSAPGPSAWLQRASLADVEQVVELITGPDLIPDTWEPEISPEELAEQAERQRIIAEGRARQAEWEASRPQAAAGYGELNRV